MRWPGSRSARLSRVLASDVIIKAVTLFLVVIIVLAMFGRGIVGRRLRQAKCPRCGRYKIGSGPCPCSRKKG
ncbi:hypothetical protein HJ526_03755 [Donghicola sp. C2-DW-16]|uniref:Short-chain dehydrogenase n=1 Tax=Donghicola mangrovi TaxID=2729614 RepID=A0ABX2PCY3_9RHOB|nr:hypothetical protein [Donghicola mangrovi]NVO26524.1 hypothetical protein [Donghicola mangrovi]